jgi:hypothetical protein
LRQLCCVAQMQHWSTPEGADTGLMMRGNIARCAIALASLVAGLSTAPPVQAQASDGMARDAARQLGNEGIDLYEQGDYAGAVDRLGRAYQVLKVPTLGLWYARALAKTGKLVEASERYAEVTHMQVDPDAPAVMQQAKRDAAQERAELQPRIPRVVVKVTGAASGEPEITVDGKPIPPALVGVAVAMNPGVRNIEARAGTQTASQQVKLAEGEKRTVELGLDAPAAAPAAAPAPAPAPEAVPATTPAKTSSSSPGAADEGPTDDGSTQRLIGWTALGVGGVGLVLGGVFYLMENGKKSELEDACDGQACPPSVQDDIDTYDQLHAFKLTGFIVGGLGLAGGAVLLLTAPDAPETGAYVAPWVGIGSAGVRGVF